MRENFVEIMLCFFKLNGIFTDTIIKKHAYMS